MGSDPRIDIIQATDAIFPWIIGTFVKSLENQRSFADIDRHLARAMLRSLATRLLAHEIVVAVDPADHDQCYGYAIGDAANRILWWAYVKYDFRGRHVGRRLLEALLGDVGKSSISLAIPTSASRHLADKWFLVNQSELLEDL